MSLQLARPSQKTKERFYTRVPKGISSRLQGRIESDSLRILRPEKIPIDFVSNDYLGFAKILSKKLRENDAKNETCLQSFGATGSRLLSGDSREIHDIEEKIASFHGYEAALFFSSGFSANYGLLTSLPTRHDSILYDELSHASIVDGVKGAHCKKTAHFKHNDLEDLRKKLQDTTGDIYVVTESVFSMDGDFAPLPELATLCEEFGAFLIVDEAHAVGIFGHCGRGRVHELSLEDKVFATVVTYGKAFGSHGASILGSKILKEFLINFCRPFIYSTAPDSHLIRAVTEGYNILEEDPTLQSGLFLLIHEFQSGARKLLPNQVLQSTSSIQGIMIPGNSDCKKVSSLLAEAGIDARAILSPTVPKGQERIRVCLHTYNAAPEVQKLLYTVSSYLKGK